MEGSENLKRRGSGTKEIKAWNPRKGELKEMYTRIKREGDKMKKD